MLLFFRPEKHGKLQEIPGYLKVIIHKINPELPLQSMYFNKFQQVRENMILFLGIWEFLAHLLSDIHLNIYVSFSKWNHGPNLFPYI